MKAHIVQMSDTILSTSSIKLTKRTLNKFEKFYVFGSLLLAGGFVLIYCD